MIRSIRDFALWLSGAVFGVIVLNWYGDRAWFVLIGLLAVAVPWDRVVYHGLQSAREFEEWYTESRESKRFDEELKRQFRK